MIFCGFENGELTTVVGVCLSLRLNSAYLVLSFQDAQWFWLELRLKVTDSNWLNRSGYYKHSASFLVDCMKVRKSG